MIKLYNGDCLEIMKSIPDKSIDMILCDLPYGTSANCWDVLIPFDKLWQQYERLIKDNGAIVLTASQPFTTKLINSNIKLFKYEWIWNKTRGSNFASSHKQPMKSHENVCVFYKKQPTYNPQYWYSTPYKSCSYKRGKAIAGIGRKNKTSASAYCLGYGSEDGRRYPLPIIEIKRDTNRIHQTQKPVALMEYLIKTYTNEGECVLDNCMGSGTTGVACKLTGRNFIGIELDEHYFEIAQQRIENTKYKEMGLFDNGN